MRPYTFVTVLLACHATTNAFSVIPSSTDLNTDPPEPLSTACGDIVRASLDRYEFFAAELALECLTSVPFNSAVATRFIAWYNQTLQFHTTPAFLKNPPQGYQQPAADILADLQQIQDQIDSNYYRNQYVFDAHIFELIRGGHDGHLDLWAGALSQFSWGASWQVVSVSTDGREEPKQYFWYNIKHYVDGGEIPSAIATINDVPVVDFLEEYASKQSFGTVEPHADWNLLTRTPAMQIMGYRSAFTVDGYFYPGANISTQYENGTIYAVPWLARYSSPGFTGPLETGGDFYNFVVLDLLPASYNESYNQWVNSSNNNDNQQSAQRTKRDTSAPANWNEVSSAYPTDTISAQDDLGLVSPGYVTGYFLEDISTAVVSIPSFDIYGDDDESFERAIVDFVNNATARNATKLVVDLQQNFGGYESLVFEAIRQLFPSISPPPTPSRMRSHPLGDYLGQITTAYFDSIDEDNEDYDYMVADEWAVTDRISFDTKQNFSSWQEFSGPLTYYKDTFSKIQEYNLTSEVFDDDDLYYNSTSIDSGAARSRRDPWDAANVVLLTDGLCASACSLFVELVTQQLGVRTVVVGGSPKRTPMQAASGTRGAAIYYSDDIDTDFANVNAIINSTNITAATTPVYLNDTGMYITYATINLRDQIRPANNVDGLPNQVLYLPANCRIWWTLRNFNNMTRLWHDVSDAIYKDQTICVGGYQNTSSHPKRSTLHHAERQLRKRTPSSVSNYIRSGISLDIEAIPNDAPSTGVKDSIGAAIQSSSITYCNTDPDCKGRGICRPTTLTCQFACQTRGKPCQTRQETVKVCAPRLDIGSSCKGTPVHDKSVSGKRASQVFKVKDVQGDAPLSVFCIPNSASAGQPMCKNP